MRLFSTVVVLLWLATLQSCNKEDASSGEPQLLWKSSLSDGKLISASAHADIQYNGGILLGGMDNGRCLYLVDIKDGKIRWKWNDYMTTDLGWLMRWPYINDNRVFILDGRHQYCINLDNGETLWKRKNVSDFGTLATGINNNYLIPAAYYPNGDGTNESKILTGNLADGTSEDIFLIPEYTRAYTDPNQQKGNIVSIDTVQIGSEKGLLIFFWDPLENYKLNIFIGLYNVTQKKWVYSKKPFALNASYTIGPPAIYNNKVVNSVGKTQQCHDLLTGDILWTRQLSELNTAYDTFVDGKILSTTQDRITHCIDPANGRDLWSLNTSGNPGIVRELNGIAYMVGGNGKLFAIDVAAGKILWQFSSPDEKINSNAFWQEGVRVVRGVNGQKGKIIVSSYLNAFCYEAAR